MCVSCHARVTCGGDMVAGSAEAESETCKSVRRNWLARGLHRAVGTFLGLIGVTCVLKEYFNY